MFFNKMKEELNFDRKRKKRVLRSIADKTGPYLLIRERAKVFGQRPRNGMYFDSSPNQDLYQGR